MFSDPQFWVAVSFFLFIAAIFNPVRKILTSSLDSQIRDIKDRISEAENIKNEAQNTLSDLIKRENEVDKEIEKLKLESEKKINQLKENSSLKLSEQIEKRRLMAENKITQILRDTNIAIKDHISNVAIEATTHLLKNKLSSDLQSNLIDESVKELNKIFKN